MAQAPQLYNWESYANAYKAKVPVPAFNAPATTQEGSNTSSSQGRQRTGMGGGQPGAAPGQLIPWGNMSGTYVPGFAGANFAPAWQSTPWPQANPLNTFSNANLQRAVDNLGNVISIGGVAGHVLPSPEGMYGPVPHKTSNFPGFVNSDPYQSGTFAGSSTQNPNVPAGSQYATGPGSGFSQTANTIPQTTNRLVSVPPTAPVSTTNPATGILSKNKPAMNGILGNQGNQLIQKAGGYNPAEIPDTNKVQPTDAGYNTTITGARYQDEYGNNQIAGYYYNKNDQKYYPIGAYPDLNTKGWWTKDQYGNWQWTGGYRGVANPLPGGSNAWNSSGYGGWGGYGGGGSYGSNYGKSAWYTALLNWRI